MLKSCLVLADISDIAFKVDNFNAPNMKKIEALWDRIEQAIRLAVTCVSSFGYNTERLTSTLAVIPIADYIMRIGNPSNLATSSDHKKDRQLIRRWLAVSLIKRAFSGQPDNVLRPIRNIMRESRNEFPLNSIVERFRGQSKSITFSQEDLERLLHLEYNEPHTFSVLSFLYPTLDFRNLFHMDHIHPRNFFKKPQLKSRGYSDEKEEFYVENCDKIGNLQLLEGTPNEEKSDKDFAVWLREAYPDTNERSAYMKNNLIPDEIDLSFGNFPEFVEARNNLIIKKLNDVLGDLAPRNHAER